MQPGNLFFKWLQENLQRLFKKSPKFFQIWQWVSGLLVALTGLPAFLQYFLTSLNITLPGPWVAFENKTIALIALGAFFMAQFPAQSTVTAVTPAGVGIKSTDSEKLPFTSQEEVKDAKKDAVKAGTTLPVVASIVTTQTNN